MAGNFRNIALLECCQRALLASKMPLILEDVKVNVEDALTEWRVKVRTVLNTLKKCGDRTIQETQLHLLEFLAMTEEPSLHSIIHQLALGFLTMADCERSFSVLKLTKAALQMIRGR